MAKHAEVKDAPSGVAKSHYFDPTDYEALQKYAQKHDIKASKILRNLVRDFLSGDYISVGGLSSDVKHSLDAHAKEIGRVLGVDKATPEQTVKSALRQWSDLTKKSR